MKLLLILCIVSMFPLLAHSQYATDKTMNEAINKSKNSPIISKELFYGFSFDMDPIQYTRTLDSLVKNDKAVEKDGSYLIARRGEKKTHFQALFPTFTKNKLTEITSYFLYETEGIENLVTDLSFENKGDKYKFLDSNGDLYFIFKNNIMILASIIDNRYIIKYTNNAE